MSTARPLRAADVAASAERLQADLIRIEAALNRYRGSPGLELLRERSRLVQSQLDTIAHRLNGVGDSSGAKCYALSEAEYMALEAAGDLCERMRETLSRYERANDLTDRGRSR